MDTLRAVAWPISVPLLESLMFMYGTVAEYSVGFVILTKASKESVDLVVSKMRNEPTSGEKLDRLPLDIAGHRPSALLMPLCYHTFVNDWKTNA